MAQSTSSQDLLNLLMRGGAADSLESLAKDQHQQLATPISPTGRPAPRPSHSREATPSGQDTLEALFSSLRGSAPPNSNISPSAVSHAERQSSTSQFQAAIASPSTSNTALRAQTGVSPISSPPHLDNAQGRSLLLSMLNVRSPPTQEAALASPSLNAAVPNTTTDKASEAEQLHGDGIKQDTNHHEQEAAEVRLADVSPTQLDATSPEDVMQEEEKAQDRGDDTIPAISVTTRQQESLDLPASSSNGSAQTIVREASPDAPESVSTAAPDLQNIVAEDKLRITDLGSSSHTLNVPSGPPDASFGVSVEAGNDEVLEPLHEIRLEAGSSSTTGERFVYDRVPISRFTSTNSYTKGKQIAVNGLIAYGTRAGRVRVIDPDTGARLIKKLHSGLATDMDLSIEFSSEGQKTRRLVTCYNNTIKVWQIPSSFDGDDATNRIVYELSLDKHIIVHSVSFSNSNANHLAFTTSRSQEVYLIDLSEQIGSDYAPATVGNTELKRFAIFTLPSVSKSRSLSIQRVLIVICSLFLR